MLRTVIAVSLVACCLALGLEEEWATFKSQYSKQYLMAEEVYRKQVFSQNLDYINIHNAEADNGEHTFWLGVNEYADMPIEEFKRVMLGYRFDATATNTNELYVPQIPDEAVPKKVDWREKGYVTPVKNQGQCGSCWAFSTTGSLEGQHFNKTKKLVSLSEQNLVDCSKKEGNMGCMGGLMDQAFKYIKKNHGIDTEASYPYKAKTGRKCEFKQPEVGATLTSWKDIPKGNEKDLQKASAELGPISVAIDAGHQSFQLYKRGVYTERECSPKKLDHGVLVVGFGEEVAEKYWLVKNSWGATWGQEGYIMMARDKENMCGIATQASYPIV
ncbi:procathepsin L-like [Littorina saxatilis]|uniref:Cathepsin L n=1 Tax=Littorina saxatilis TaxID=31220 RepID=A0AAN9AT60_9CAEN